jgi:hypothetical protein
MAKSLNILAIVILLIILIAGVYYAIQLNKIKEEVNKEIQVVEVKGNITANGPGVGGVPFAKCPSGTEVISGGCTSDSSSRLVLRGGASTKSNGNLDYNDAWECNFMAEEEGVFYYTITANCR